MDRMRACGVCDVGSIPTEGTRFLINYLKFFKKLVSFTPFLKGKKI